MKPKIQTQTSDVKKVEKKLKCNFCEKIFSHRSGLSRHLKICKIVRKKINFINSPTTFCESCKRSVLKQYVAQHQRSYEHLDNLTKLMEGKIELFNSSINGDVKTYRVKDDNPLEIDVRKLLNDNKSTLVNQLEYDIIQHKNLKFQVSHTAVYTRMGDIQSGNQKNKPENEDVLKAIKTFNSLFYEINSGSDIESIMSDAFENLIKKIEEFKANSSGWTINFSLQITIQILKVAHFGSSYIPIPKRVKLQSYLINIVNEDLECIVWYVF